MATEIEEIGPLDAATFKDAIANAYRPVVMRGQVSRWPAVAAARSGDAAMVSYIKRFDCGALADVLVGPANCGGRFFYNDAVDGFNFERGRVPLAQMLDELIRFAEMTDPPALYAGAATTDTCLPGWAAANPLALDLPGSAAKIWIGNASRVAPHFDVAQNVACVVAGTRRFTLFPPDQVDNLYIGPLEFTMAGQPASMVDLAAPDLARFPKFAVALEHAQTAELGPGDAIFIPSLWWHGVSAVSPFNVLVNYWWGESHDASPFAALIHAMLTVRDLPALERTAWRGLFEHYAFSNEAPKAAAHLPLLAHGVLGRPSQERTARIKAYVMRALTRGSG